LYSFSHGRDKSKPWTSSIVRFSAISLGCKINVNAIRRAHSIVCCDFREIETIYHSNLDLVWSAVGPRLGVDMQSNEQGHAFKQEVDLQSRG
jgi:hypothetical protein